MSSQQIILIDIPTKAPERCWSLNPWKTRFVLNYKRLDYKTQWTLYPDIRPTLEGRVPPNTVGAAHTSPSIILPDGQVIMESRRIASALEALYPTPPLHLDAPCLPRLEAQMPRCQMPIRPIFFPLVPAELLDPANHEYWHRTRSAVVGMSMDEFQKSKTEAECWSEAAAGLKEVTKLLCETEGPYFMGKQVSYADFVWAGYLLFVRNLGEERLEACLEAAGERDRHLALLKGVEKWSERDGH